MTTKFFKKLLWALALLAPLHAATAGQGLARMWVVKGPSTDDKPRKIYILAITHAGLESEYDTYLDRIVLPAFQESSRLLFENAPVNALSAKSCEKPWTETEASRGLMQMARDKAGALIAESMQPPVKDMDVAKAQEAEATIEMTVNHLSEYGLITFIKSASSSEPNPASNTVFLRGQVTGYLLQKYSGIETKSVDTADELVTAYCSMTKHRAEYFRRSLQIDGFDTSNKITQTNVASINSDFLESIRRKKIVGVFKSDSAEEEKAMVCNRTKAWLEKIIEDKGDGVKFYALGFAHLFPSVMGNKNCKGLLNDLKSSGFSVSLVQ